MRAHVKVLSVRTEHAPRRKRLSPAPLAGSPVIQQMEQAQHLLALEQRLNGGRQLDPALAQGPIGKRRGVKMALKLAGTDQRLEQTQARSAQRRPPRRRSSWWCSLTLLRP